MPKDLKDIRVNAKIINEKIIPKIIIKDNFFIFKLSYLFNSIMDITLMDKTGKTQGIKLRMNPPINAKNKNLKIFGSNLRSFKSKKIFSKFVPSEITNSIGSLRFSTDSSVSKKILVFFSSTIDFKNKLTSLEKGYISISFFFGII